MKEYYLITPCDDGHVDFLPPQKAPCITATYYKGPVTTYGDRPAIMEIEKHIIKPYTMNGGGYRYIGQEKVPTICAMYHNVFSTFPEKPYVMEIKKELEDDYSADAEPICVAMRGRNPENPSNRTKGIHLEQRLEANVKGKTNCLTTVSKDNMVAEGYQITHEGDLIVPEATSARHIIVPPGECFDGAFPDSKTRRGRSMGDKANCITTQNNGMYRYEGCTNSHTPSHAIVKTCRIRRLTPTECARLQSIPDWYEWKGKFPDGKIKDTSDTQKYKMLGNGWNVEVIKHIFSFIDVDKILKQE